MECAIRALPAILCLALSLGAHAQAAGPAGGEAPGAEAASGATVAAPPAPADAVAAASAEAASGATPSTLPPAAGRPFLGFRSEVAFHEAAGWGSTGLLLAAGAVGAVRALGLQDAGHQYRRAIGVRDEEGIGAACADKIRALWAEDQGLRWVHVGLLGAGETLYLAGAFTGSSWIDFSRPATLRVRIHRWAFFGHAALMATELVLGLVSTDALSRGDHELVSSLGVAHAAIGIAIPVLMAGAGLAEVWPGPAGGK